jgi:pteridine reductase
MSEHKKCALITGAAQRIGAAITHELHRRDFNVIIHYRESHLAATQLANTLNTLRADSAICLQADLCSATETRQLAMAAMDAWGRLDVLVNNASSFYPTPIGHASEQDWHALIDSNLKGPFFLTQALADALKKTQGCIINLIDIYAANPMLEHSIYCIAKAGVSMMTKALAKEFAPYIRVNGISPGAILWPEKPLSEAQKSTAVAKIPMQKIGDPIDIARTVAFIACDAPYITGQIIAVDGGRSLSM